MTADLDLDALDRAALAATPGPMVPAPTVVLELIRRLREAEQEVKFQKRVVDGARRQQADLLERLEAAESAVMPDVSKLDVSDGDVVVVRTKRGALSDGVLRQMCDFLRSALPKNSNVVVLVDGVEIEAMDKDTLRRLAGCEQQGS